MEIKSVYLQHFQLQKSFLGIFSVRCDAPSLNFYACLASIVMGDALMRSKRSTTRANVDIRKKIYLQKGKFHLNFYFFECIFLTSLTSKYRTLIDAKVLNSRNIRGFPTPCVAQQPCEICRNYLSFLSFTRATIFLDFSLAQNHFMTFRRRLRGRKSLRAEKITHEAVCNSMTFFRGGLKGNLRRAREKRKTHKII